MDLEAISRALYEQFRGVGDPATVLAGALESIGSPIGAEAGASFYLAPGSRYLGLAGTWRLSQALPSEIPLGLRQQVSFQALSAPFSAVVDPLDGRRLLQDLSLWPDLSGCCCNIWIPTTSGVETSGLLAYACPPEAEAVLSPSRLAPIGNQLYYQTRQVGAPPPSVSESSLERDQFINMLAHELRSPLTSICGFAEILLRRGAQKQPEALQRYYSVIHDESVRLNQLVGDLLDLSRLRVGKMSIHLLPHDPGKLVDEAVRLASQQDGFAGGRLEQEISAGLPQVLSDPKRTPEALARLLLVGLRLCAAEVRISAVAEEDYVTICYDLGDFQGDSGSIETLFEAFPMLEKRAARATGSGLALPLARALIEAAMGSVEARRMERGGARLLVSLRKHG